MTNKNTIVNKLNSEIPFCVDISETDRQTTEIIYNFIKDNLDVNKATSEDVEDYSDQGYWGHLGVSVNNRIMFWGNVESFIDDPYFDSMCTVKVYTTEGFMNLINGNHNVTTNDSIKHNVYQMILNNIKDGITVYHFRNKDKSGNILSNGGKTVVFYHLDSGEILMGVSRCSKEDNFDRKQGVMLAKERFEFMQGAQKVPAKYDVKEFIDTYGTTEQKRLFNQK